MIRVFLILLLIWSLSPFVHRKHPKTFAFDHCFDSHDPNSPGFTSQEQVFDSLGRDILENAFEGYNACIFAYGQTGKNVCLSSFTVYRVRSPTHGGNSTLFPGSGKSYTMMGGGDSKGIIPRLCDALFDTIAKRQSSELSYKVEVSYMEIYNEKVREHAARHATGRAMAMEEHGAQG